MIKLILSKKSFCLLIAIIAVTTTCRSSEFIRQRRERNKVCSEDYTLPAPPSGRDLMRYKGRVWAPTTYLKRLAAHDKKLVACLRETQKDLILTDEARQCAEYRVRAFEKSAMPGSLFPRPKCD